MSTTDKTDEKSLTIRIKNPRLVTRFNRLIAAMQRDSRYMKYGEIGRHNVATIALCEWLERQERALSIEDDMVEGRKVSL